MNKKRNKSFLITLNGNNGKLVFQHNIYAVYLLDDDDEFEAIQIFDADEEIEITEAHPNFTKILLLSIREIRREQRENEKFGFAEYEVIRELNFNVS